MSIYSLALAIPTFLYYLLLIYRPLSSWRGKEILGKPYFRVSHTYFPTVPKTGQVGVVLPHQGSRIAIPQSVLGRPSANRTFVCGFGKFPSHFWRCGFLKKWKTCPQSIHDFPHQMVLEDRFIGHFVLQQTNSLWYNIKEKSPLQARVRWAL